VRNPTPEQVHARRWATLAVLCLSLLLTVIDGTIVNVALPTISKQLHASTSALQWVTDAYTLAMAGLLLSLGSLGDRTGRHRTLAGGLLVFGVGSGLAAVSGSAAALIGFRALMGAGAAAIMPATLSILSNVFTSSVERAKAIAAWSAVAGLGVAIGPSLGGWLLEHFSWGSVFAVNLPVVAIALVAGRYVVPPSKNPDPKALDPIGTALSVIGLVAVVYSIIEAPSNGWLSAGTLGVAASGLAVLAAFVALELRSSHPMVDLRIFRNPRFSAASFAVTMVFLALLGWLFLFTQQMQVVLGYDPLQAGVRALPFAFTLAALSQPAVKMAARLGAKPVVASGLALMGGGLALMASSTTSTGYGYLLAASIVIAAGMGLAMAPATESIMGTLPPAQAGVGSAVNDTTRAVGGALGVAVMGSVAASIFANKIEPVLAGLPRRDAVLAKASISAAVTVGQHAPGPVGQGIIEGARQAFMSGARTAELIAVVAALAGSVVAVVFLPARATRHALAEDAFVPAPAEAAAAAVEALEARAA